jgi:hypothetical protein
MPGVESGHVDRLALEVDALMSEVGPLENFVLPGGCRSAALLHLARTVCRRAERETVRLSREEATNPVALTTRPSFRRALCHGFVRESVSWNIRDLLGQPRQTRQRLTLSKPRKSKPPAEKAGGWSNAQAR